MAKVFSGKEVRYERAAPAAEIDSTPTFRPLYKPVHSGVMPSHKSDTQMKQETIQSFLLMNGEKFDSYQLPEIQRQLESIDDSKSGMVLGVSLQNPTLILILAIFTGWDRFFIGDIGLGVLKVITCNGCGIWWLVDIFSAKKRTYQYNYKKFTEMLLLSK